MANVVTTDTQVSQKDLNFALEIADLADSISMPRFRSANLRISTKPDRSFVTDADEAVENAVRTKILATLPNDFFYGEETGKGGGKNSSTTDNVRREWVIDPIDGTANFLRGVPGWATLIALLIDGKPLLGVVSMPCLHTRWWAISGGGAFKQTAGNEPQKINVSKITALADASLSFQSIQQWEEAGKLENLLALRRAVWRDRAYGDAWSYMALAEGLIDIVGEHDLKAYDIAAHAPIISEAGGMLTDDNGNNIFATDNNWSGSVLATNSLLHSAALQHIAD